MFDYTKPARRAGDVENRRDDEMFPGPRIPPPGWSLPHLRKAAANATMLLKHHPEFKIQSPVSQDNIVVPYKLIDSAPLLVTRVTPEEVVRTDGGRL